jgi:putative toxin-antitoxin system antitoxin component (TIGR02293 family)
MSVNLGQMSKVKKHKTREDLPSIAAEPMVEVAVENISFYKKLGISVNVDDDIKKLEYIKKGVKKNVLLNTMKLTGFSLEDMAEVLHTSDRTLRRYTNDDILNTDQSERLLELAELCKLGTEVFGNTASFNQWMNSSIMALNYSTPKSYLTTIVGIHIVAQLLGRLQYGVFS